MKASSVVFFALAVSAVIAAEYPYPGPAASPPKPLQVLLVTGCDYPGHKWSLTTPVLAQGLREDPRADVRVVEDAHFLDSAALSRYRVVVLNYMNWKTTGPSEAARANLKRFVEGGGGLVLVHFTCGAWMEWPEFVNLAGRVWNPKLRGHDPRGPFTVNIVDKEHPITKGLPDFETDDELYTCLDGTVPIQVLAKATSKVDKKDYPMAFVLNVGKGRVFHSPLGHDPKAFSPSVLELFRRGTAWAAGELQ
ncbi:MAG: ThuA domain-containing protein [Verrucomicrobia bacterium]|nr:ThuA domain-containing protein [Verrucomicrobiota bacterium]